MSMDEAPLLYFRRDHANFPDVRTAEASAADIKQLVKAFREKYQQFVQV